MLGDDRFHPEHVSAELTVSPEAQRAAQEWDELQRQLAMDRLRQEVELSELAYLREHILSQPSVARAYWLKHHPNAFGDLLDDRFERIAEKLGRSNEDPNVAIARVISDFLSDLGADQRQYLLAQLAKVFTSFERTDLAERLPDPSSSAESPVAHS